MLGRLLFLVGLAAASIKNCGQSPLFTITELSQDPADTIVGGQNLSLTLKYSAPEEITAGTVTKSITLNFIPFSPTTEDLCVNAPCPITVGDHDGSSWSLFPSGVTGTLVSKVVWADTQGRELLCVQSSLKASASMGTNVTKYLRGV
jgi:hypothetical protein